MSMAVSTFKVQGWDGTPLEGAFYRQDLQLVTVLFRIEKESRSKCVGKDGVINTTFGSRGRPFASGKGERTMGDFYMTLPSNPLPEFPDNSPSSFKVRLPQRLTLLGQGWRVALSSMFVPDTSVNLYHLVPKHAFLFYTTLMRPVPRSDVQVNMMNNENCG